MPAAIITNPPGGTPSTPFYALFFGTGVDGNLVFDGVSNIVLHGVTMVPAANVYTLTTNIYAANLTVNAGVTIIANGYVIFASGTLTNNGTIKRNGNSGASGAAGGTKGAGLTYACIGNAYSSPTGADGGNGNQAAGSNGTARSQSIACPNTQAAIASGAGGAGVSAGGNAANATALNWNSGECAGTSAPMWTVNFIGYQYWGGGSGGGGGGGDNAAKKGGGGGSGGGIVFICAQAITGTGLIQAHGGNGGNGDGTGALATGGGGGGSGGAIVVYTLTPYASSGQTATCTGGTGGTGANGGANGSNGADGTVRWYIAA